MTTRSTAGQSEPEATSRPVAPNAQSTWPAPLESFFTWLGLGDSSVGAALAALLVATALLYARSLSFNFVLDDLDWIGNPYVKHWSFVWRSLIHDTWWYLDPDQLPQSSYYRPFLNLWAAVNFHLFGFHPSGWHAAMILFYLIVVWQVFRVASILTTDRWTGLFTAGIFAFMPTHAESVVWASTICQPLLASSELGAFELFLRRASSPESDPRRTPRLALSLTLFAGALLSYETAVTFPFLVGTYAFLFPPSSSSRRFPNRASTCTAAMATGWSDIAAIIPRMREALRAMWPYALMVLPYLVVRYAVLGFITRPEMHDPLSHGEAALSLPGVILSYLALLAMPWLAGPEHPVDVVKSVTAQGFVFPLATLIALSVAGWFLLRHHPHRRLYLFCVAWFFLTFAAMLNLRGLFAESPIHDRYLYFPSFGVCLMAADLALTYGRRSERKMKLIWTATALFASAYAAMTFTIEHDWHDNVTLFKRCVEESPDAAIWHYRLGRTLESQGQLPQARRHLEDTIRLKKDAGGDIYYELGVVDERLGDPKSAERMMVEGIKRVAHPPIVAYTDLAIAADSAGDTRGSEAALKIAESMPGGPAAVAVARAQILRLHGDVDGSARALRELLVREPNHMPALTALGMALESQRQYQGALSAYQRASSLAPKNPKLHYLVALMLHRLKRDDEARRECKIAIGLTLDNADMQALLAEIDRGNRPR
ncbi:MAG TPA: tetratricopeptide repeat protein [Candidatus Binataceae bacterium]|nr:tetratricopeptide repeat protein [Candidatus Binataceae bacterium]